MRLDLGNDNWEEVYDGYGEIKFEDDKILLLPDIPSDEEPTHSALVTSVFQVRDFTLEINAVTKRQLRQETEPNAWEVFWIFFNYNPTEDGKKTTNYFILKPNGFELGGACDELEQRFMKTGETVQMVIGEEYTYKICKKGFNIKISINDTEIINDDFELYDEYGSIGLYCEDSEVVISSIELLTADIA